MSPVASQKWKAATLASARDDWETPQALFDSLNSRYGFTVDAAANDTNAKLPRYWTATTDAFAQDWSRERVFCNPPFGRDIARWTRKAVSEANRGAFVVMLVPARTDTKWWHDSADAGARAQFLRGRLRYELGGVAGDAAPFPSCLLFFGGEP